MKKPNVRGLKAGSKLAEQAQQKALMSYVSARKQLAMLEQQVQDLERMIAVRQCCGERWSHDVCRCAEGQ